MKIRQGFVSNSSSSSFVIGIRTKLSPCPTCGIGTDILIDVLRHLGANNYNEYTRLYDIDEYLERQQSEIDTCEKNLLKTSLSTWSKQCYTSLEEYKQQQREWLNQFKEKKERILQAVDNGYEVYQLKISHCDTGTQALFDILYGKGIIEILEEEE